MSTRCALSEGDSFGMLRMAIVKLVEAGLSFSKILFLGTVLTTYGSSVQDKNNNIISQVQYIYISDSSRDRPSQAEGQGKAETQVAQMGRRRCKYEYD